MKTKAVKILFIMLIVWVSLSFKANKVFASEASVSANNCNVGESFTVTVTIPQEVRSYQCYIKVTFADGSSTDNKYVMAYGKDLNDLSSGWYWPGNATKSFEAKAAGNATVSVSELVMYDESRNLVNSISNLTYTGLVISDPSTNQAQNTTPSSDSDSSSSTTTTPVQTNLEFSDASEIMYTVQKVNMRQNYGTSSSIIQTLPVGATVTRTGVSKGNCDGYAWSRISYNGITGYVITGSLTYTAPTNEEETPVEEEPTDEEDDTNEVTDENTDENTEEILNKLSEELGAIPEVGVNIMPCMFLGCVVACVVMGYEVKKYKKDV